MQKAITVWFEAGPARPPQREPEACQSQEGTGGQPSQHAPATPDNNRATPGNAGVAPRVPIAAADADSEEDVVLVEDRCADEVRAAKKRKLGVVDVDATATVPSSVPHSAIVLE